MDAIRLLTLAFLIFVAVIALCTRRWEPITEDEAEETPGWAREELE